MGNQSGNSNLSFAKLSSSQKGLIFALLSRSHFDLLNKYKLEHKKNMIDNWKKFDEVAFDNLNTIGKCVFITSLGNKVIGFGSYDPRQWPEIGLIGHNCILPEFRGHGYGRAQIIEIIRRFRKKKYKKARVSTGDQPFFLASQKMYLSCGFRETGRFKKVGTDFSEIEYELYLC
jgi:RimJ/RimL family protein N-acetyltransferase